jgi:hypothetical protein
MRFRDWVSRLAHSYPAHSTREFFPELITASRRNQSKSWSVHARCPAAGIVPVVCTIGVEGVSCSRE